MCVTIHQLTPFTPDMFSGNYKHSKNTAQLVFSSIRVAAVVLGGSIETGHGDVQSLKQTILSLAMSFWK